jgi:hypothetical protein
MNKVNLTAILLIKDVQTVDREQIDNLQLHGIDRIVAIIAGLRDQAAVRNSYAFLSEFYVHRLVVCSPGCWITPALDWATKQYGGMTEWIVPVIGDETFTLDQPELSSFLTSDFAADAAAIGFLYNFTGEPLRRVKMVTRSSRITDGWMSPFVAVVDGVSVYTDGTPVSLTYDLVRGDAPGADFVFKKYSPDYLFYRMLSAIETREEPDTSLNIITDKAQLERLLRQAREMNPKEKVQII